MGTVSISVWWCRFLLLPALILAGRVCLRHFARPFPGRAALFMFRKTGILVTALLRRLGTHPLPYRQTALQQRGPQLRRLLILPVRRSGQALNRPRQRPLSTPHAGSISGRGVPAGGPETGVSLFRRLGWVSRTGGFVKLIRPFKPSSAVHHARHHCRTCRGRSLASVPPPEAR